MLTDVIIKELTSVSHNPLILFALIAGLAADFYARRQSGRLVVCVFLGIVAFLTQRAVGVQEGAFVFAPVLCCLAFAGAFCTGAAVLEWVWRRQGLQPVRRKAAISSLLMVLFLGIIGRFLASTADICPLTFDRNLHFFDQLLGWNAAFSVGHLMNASIWLRNACFLAYNGLPLSLMIAACLEIRGPGRALGGIWGSCLAAGILGAVTYLILPACGPIYLFPHEFPYLNAHAAPPPVMSAAGIVATPIPFAPRNAMPSLHFTWAFLLFLSSLRAGRAQRLFFAAIFVLTALATVGFGEHYLADLLEALVFTAAIQHALRPDLGSRRWITVGFLAALFVGWLVFLRWGIMHYAGEAEWTVIGAAILTATVSVAALTSTLRTATAAGRAPVGVLAARSGL